MSKKKFQIKQHISNFVDGMVPITEQFDSLEELMEIPFVKKFRKHPFKNEMPHIYFNKYSISSEKNLLMAEYFTDYLWDVGWWPIGYISINFKNALGLDEWECKSEVYKEA